MPFLYATSSCEYSKLTLTVYQKPAFSGVCSYVGSSILNIYNMGLIHIFVSDQFWKSCNCSMFHSQLTLLKEIFQKNCFPKHFFNRCSGYFWMNRSLHKSFSPNYYIRCFLDPRKNVSKIWCLLSKTQN